MVSANTPVLVGAGQFTERLDDDNYQGFSAIEIATRAAQAALTDAGCEQLSAHIDLIATTRTFDDSVPTLAFPFGRSNNFPRSICRRLGIDPEFAIWETAGGNTPQDLVIETCQRIDQGETQAALLCGAEAISTARHLLKLGQQVDWSETIDAQVEDRGVTIDHMVSPLELAHGLNSPALLYGVLENARRARLHLDREEYARSMGELFAPFSQVAATNPYSSAVNKAYSAEELCTPTASNRLIADPYPRLLVSRDQVNQGAALVIISTALADRLGIPQEHRVYLHGCASAREKDLLERPDLSRAPSAARVATAALDAAGIGSADIDMFDHYSCFPIAVSNVLDGLGIAATDARPKTLTGGLCYFGGPGNNYSMHSIAEVVKATRHKPGSVGYIGANGGFLSKYSAGIYSSAPRPFTAVDKAKIQAELDAVPSVPIAAKAEGSGTIETFTVSYGREGEPVYGVVIGRVADSGKRFIARSAKDDSATAAALLGPNTFGHAVNIRHEDGLNIFRLA